MGRGSLCRMFCRRTGETSSLTEAPASRSFYRRSGSSLRRKTPSTRSLNSAALLYIEEFIEATSFLFLSSSSRITLCSYAICPPMSSESPFSA